MSSALNLVCANLDLRIEAKKQYPLVFALREIKEDFWRTRRALPRKRFLQILRSSKPKSIVESSLKTFPNPQVGVVVLLFKGNKVLLGRRRSDIAYEEFAPPGGHLEFGESPKECAAREVAEETGVDITGIEFVTVINLIKFEPNPLQRVVIVMRAVQANPEQIPANLEPDKCDGWEWYDWNHLPNPLLGPLQAVVQEIKPFTLN